MGVITSWFPKPSGVALYRTIQPLKQLKADHKVVLIDNKLDIRNPDHSYSITSAFLNSNVIFVNYTDLISNEIYDRIMPQNEEEQRMLGKKIKWWVDCDDYFFGISPYNRGYRDWGISDFTIMLDGVITPLWKDKVICDGQKGNAFNISRNRTNIKRLIQLLQKADVVTVTTQRLKDRIKRFNKNIVVMPNAIDFTIFDYTKKVSKDDGFLRIGWTFSPSHLPDWFDVRETLEKFLNENPKVKFVFIGLEPFGNKFNPEQVEHIGWTDTHKEYANNLLNSGVDIAICPLSAEKFNYFKSPLKWEEWSAIKVPCILSNVMYNDHVKNRDTALMYGNLKELTARLKEMTESKELRESIAERAYKHIKKEYDINVIGEKYKTMIKNLMEV